MAKRKRLNPKRRAKKKPAVEGRVVAAYLLPRENKTLHISEVIDKIKRGEAIKIPPAVSWFDEGSSTPEASLELNVKGRVVDGFLIEEKPRLQQPNWCADFVRQFFKRAEYDRRSFN